MLVVFPYIGSECMSVAQLSSFLNREGIETRLAFEPNLFDDTKFLHMPSIPKLMRNTDRFAEHIVEQKPDVLAFSVLTLNFGWAMEVAEKVKQMIDVPIVFGGPHVQAMGKYVLSQPMVDFVILGEGEYALTEFCQTLDQGVPDLSIKNLGYKKDGELHFNPVRPVIEDLDSLPFCDRTLWEPFEDYKESMLFLCGRGCVFKCSFCAHSFQRDMYENKNRYVRFRSVDNVIAEMKMLVEKYNPKTFQIQDDIFMINKRFFLEFCERYPKEVGVPFQVTGYASILREDIVKRLREAGCTFMQVGVQTMNESNRHNILNRMETNEEVANVINWCRKHDMGISIDYIFFPWEANVDDQLDAARFFQENRPSRIANFFLTYLPGTTIINYAMKHGYIDEKHLDNIANGREAYYHQGGSMVQDKEKMTLFNNFYNFFLLLLIVPERFSEFLFKIKAYKYARFVPKTFMVVAKELILPIFMPNLRHSPFLVKYFYYYTKNFKNFVLRRYTSPPGTAGGPRDDGFQLKPGSQGKNEAGNSLAAAKDVKAA